MNIGIIGFSGPKGVGKNFVATIAGDLLTSSIYRSGPIVEFGAFAKPIKDFCVNVLGLPYDLVWGSDHDKNTLTKFLWESMPAYVQANNPGKSGQMTIREVMQVYGTDMGRDVWGNDIWINALKRMIDASPARYFLVTDLRFQNEIDIVHDWGGKVWKIEGPQRGDAATLNDGHKSEKCMDSAAGHDIVIANGIEDDRSSLETKIRSALGI